MKRVLKSTLAATVLGLSMAGCATGSRVVVRAVPVKDVAPGERYFQDMVFLSCGTVTVKSDSGGKYTVYVPHAREVVTAAGEVIVNPKVEPWRDAPSRTFAGVLFVEVDDGEDGCQNTPQ